MGLQLSHLRQDIIPIYTYNRNHLVHPSVRGISPNLMDAVNFRYISLDKDWKATD